MQHVHLPNLAMKSAIAVDALQERLREPIQRDVVEVSLKRGRFVLPGDQFLAYSGEQDEGRRRQSEANRSWAGAMPESVCGRFLGEVCGALKA